MGASGLLRLSSLTDIRPGGMTAFSLGNIVTYYERWTVAISPSHLCHHSTSALSLSPRVGMVSDKEGRAGSHSITLRLSSIYASTRARTRPRVSLLAWSCHPSQRRSSLSLPPQSLPVRSIPPTYATILRGPLLSSPRRQFSPFPFI